MTKKTKPSFKRKVNVIPLAELEDIFINVHAKRADVIEFKDRARALDQRTAESAEDGTAAKVSFKDREKDLKELVLFVFQHKLLVDKLGAEIIFDADEQDDILEVIGGETPEYLIRELLFHTAEQLAKKVSSLRIS